MNFLAHIYLTMPSRELTIGNFIGDFVKGSDLTGFSEEISQGITPHRKIDHFTDHHSKVKESKQRLWSSYRHYAGVIIDMYYDHILARNWQKFSPIPLKDFTRSFYSLAEDFRSIIPEKANHMLLYMRRDDWLYNYQFIEGIDRALKGMSQRTSHISGMEKASRELKNNLIDFEGHFMSFFPELVSFVKQEREALAS